MKDKRVCIGKIVAAHGIKGEVKVLSYTLNGADIDKYGEAENFAKTRKFNIKVVGSSKGSYRVKIKCIDNRNDAEALVGTELYVARDVLPKLEDDEYYFSDLIGLKVCLKTKENEIGKVVCFDDFGAGTIMEIKLNNQKETEMLPFTMEYVPTINLKEGYIIVSSATMVFAADDEEN
jgi:16S rRNA processing protein RimM